MGMTFWLSIVVAGIFLWWASFYATKRMRIEKNREREEQARRNLTRQAAAQAEETDTEKD